MVLPAACLLNDSNNICKQTFKSIVGFDMKFSIKSNIHGRSLTESKQQISSDQLFHCIRGCFPFGVSLHLGLLTNLKYLIAFFIHYADEIFLD